MPSDDADLGLLSPGWGGRPIATASGDAAVLAGIVLFEVALATVTAPTGAAHRILEAARDIQSAPSFTCWRRPIRKAW